MNCLIDPRRGAGTPLLRDWHLLANPGRLSATARMLASHVLETGQFRPAEAGAGVSARG